MIKCPYCNSGRIKTTGGDYGNPFDRKGEKIICLDCGRTIYEGEAEKYPQTPDLSAMERMIDELENAQKEKPVVIIEMTASAAGIMRKEKAVIPYIDGEYSLHGFNYPLNRFGSIIIRGDTVTLDGETSKLTHNILQTVKHYTAYAPDKHPEAETIEIRIYTDME